jgi:hypothetical protein
MFKQETFEKEIIHKVYNFLYQLVGEHQYSLFKKVCTSIVDILYIYVS